MENGRRYLSAGKGLLLNSYGRQVKAPIRPIGPLKAAAAVPAMRRSRDDKRDEPGPWDRSCYLTRCAAMAR